ncbi:hypothetical protein HDU86_001354 [Geranomyces michiganensis]|nr:hypothetical protein HDU86_001354 [Geranomyces michiganensis]
MNEVPETVTDATTGPAVSTSVGTTELVSDPLEGATAVAGVLPCVIGSDAPLVNSSLSSVLALDVAGSESDQAINQAGNQAATATSVAETNSAEAKASKNDASKAAAGAVGAAVAAAAIAVAGMAV